MNILKQGKYPYIVRTSFNNGQRGYIEEDIVHLNNGNTISFGQDTATVFYQNHPYFTGDKIKVLQAKDNRFDRNNALFFIATITKAFSDFGWGQSSFCENTLNQQIIYLPITEQKNIDFEFIDTFVREIEEEYVNKLKVYLDIFGLSDCNLTNEEKKIFVKLKDSNIEWREYKLEDLFEKITTAKLAYQAKELPEKSKGEYTLPCLTYIFRNLGFNYYAPREGATILKNVISIPSNSDVYRAYFQSNEFTVLSDAYAIQWKDKSREISQNQYLFMVMCINKVTDLPIYSYKNKLGGWNVVKNKYIQLPTKNGCIDFHFMGTLISAIKKLAIKDVSAYIAEKNTK